MKVQKQITQTVDQSELDFMPDFVEKFEEKVNEITITINFGFEIVLYKKFQDDKKVKKSIRKFILKELDIENVEFVCDPLPF